MIITSTNQIHNHPQKIISLVPSQTELLSWLGLDNEVNGITKFCIHPHTWFKTKTKVGGTKNVNVELVKKLKPDLIIANKEENVKDQIEELSNNFNVYVTDVNSLEEALQMIADVGNLTHKIKEAETLVAKIKINFTQIPISTNKLKACYLIWQKPYMTIGGDTFINDLMNYCGLKNIFENKTRYPQITLEELIKSECKLILLSSEPYPFNQKHVDELKHLLPGKKILLADGEIFSWYGSRLLKAPSYFTKLMEEIKNS